MAAACGCTGGAGAGGLAEATVAGKVGENFDEDGAGAGGVKITAPTYSGTGRSPGPAEEEAVESRSPQAGAAAQYAVPEPPERGAMFGVNSGKSGVTAQRSAAPPRAARPRGAMPRMRARAALR